MNVFESSLATAATGPTPTLLGAVALVVNANGTILYHHSAGHQTLSPTSPPLSPSCTFELGSAGKFLTHLAALRLVAQNHISLDAPVRPLLPELAALPVISANADRTPGSKPYVLRAPSTDITLRHLLLHASGIGDGSHPLIESWKQDRPATTPSESGIVNHFSYPLLFDPGTGYAYGASIYWTELLLSRLTSLPIGGATEVHVLAPLNLTSSAVRRHDIARLAGRLLQMVERGAGGTVADARDHVAQSAVSSAEDLGAVLAALLAAEPTFLPRDSIDLLFKGQFAADGDAMEQLRRETEGYGAPAGVPGDLPSPPVNWSAAGLVVERELPLVHLPAGSVTWDGMPNVVWVMSRARGLGMVFATQLLPTGDKQTVELAQAFFRGAWATF